MSDARRLRMMADEIIGLTEELDEYAAEGRGSREMSIVKTKLDEARLWLGEAIKGAER